MTEKKAIFLDIDGTMTTFRGILPDSAKEALARAHANGHELVICTGRTATQIYPFLSDSGFFSGAVMGAGADVRRKGKILYQHFVDPGHLRQIIDYFEAVNTFYFVQCVSGVYGTKKMINRTRTVFAGDSMDQEERERLLGKTFLTKDPRALTDVNKFCFYEAEATIPEMRRALGDYFDIMESSFRLTDKSDGEITVRGIDKAFGMQKFLDVCGLGREDTVAFGDGPNDYEMLEFAGIGVAMGNAADSLKEKADLVTDAVDRDGLYNAFEKLGLI